MCYKDTGGVYVMSLVKHKDNRTGITYVYESESYYDKEKRQSRARRTLIGKLDEQTGEIVPTDGRGKNRKKSLAEQRKPKTLKECHKQLDEQELLLLKLSAENQMLQQEKEALLQQLYHIQNN